MKPHDDIDDLEFLAEQGFAEAGLVLEDIRMLRNRARNRISFLDSGGGFALLCSVCGAMLAITVFFGLQNNLNPQVEPARQAQLPVGNDMTSMPEVMLDTVQVRAELFEKPVAGTHAPQNESQAKEQATDTLNLSTIILQPHEMQVPVAEDGQLRSGINSPVRFIHDLKVSNYAMLYLKNTGKPGLGGHPASMDGDGEKQAIPGEDHEVWLHERFAEGLLMFKKQKYPEALHIFAEVAAFNEEDVNCAFYSAMASYYLQKYESAIRDFDACIQARNNAFAEESAFYKAMSLSAVGKKHEAMSLFARIEAAHGFYAARASAMLRGTNIQ